MMDGQEVATGRRGAGKVLSVLGNLGLADMRLEHLHEVCADRNRSFRVGEWELTPYTPEWWQVGKDAGVAQAPVVEEPPVLETDESAYTDDGWYTEEYTDAEYTDGEYVDED